MTGRPAATLLHLGAGLGNGIANLHNARRAGTPLINIVGDHAVHHVAYDAPLTSDVEAVAKPVSAWIRTARTAEGLAGDARAAVAAALCPNPNPLGNVATLIVPADCAWGEGRDAAAIPVADRARVADAAIAAAVVDLDEHAVLLLDGPSLDEAGIRAAGRIAAASGARIFSTTFPARVESGPNLPAVARMPYFPEQVLETLKDVRRLVLAGSEAPVSFFAYRNMPSSLVPDGCSVVRLSHRHEDCVDALARLADAIDANEAFRPAGLQRADLPEGRISTGNVARVLAQHLTDGAIVAVDSGGGGAAYPVLQRAARHTWLNLTGGSIGQGGPVATGAALACPERPVFALLGDGGAMYTIQCLWTQARERLNVVTVIFSNKSYGILDVEYRRLGINEVGEKAASLFDLGSPNIDWVQLAGSMGVPGMRAATCVEFDHGLRAALDADGPYLIEVAL